MVTTLRFVDQLQMANGFIAMTAVSKRLSMRVGPPVLLTCCFMYARTETDSAQVFATDTDVL